LKSLFSEEQVYFGGRTLREDTFIEPTLLTDIDKESKIAQEEIFGPILPVIPYSDLSILSEDLNKKASPLVTYLFSESKKQASYIEQTLKSGSMSVNQVIKQAASPRIPFGGVGESGFGRYHGEESFKTFSYQKANSTK
ncbi:aldehyde dehydrogenase family protein, partial [Salmonella enterica subsp. enterica serovar Typhimurium]|uniref:aldehyde dehydrogenase family protein n=1 Tax=Salmonella enterica TaxID=28901 RepID=UPI000CB28B21